MKPLQVRLIAVFFALFITVPLFAHMVGVRPGEIENRRLADRPDVEVDRMLDDDYYSGWTAYLNDAFPFRAAAIRFNLRTEEALFGSTSSDVLQGEDGWLYLQRSFSRPCEAALDTAEAMQVLDDLVASIDEDGIPLALTVAPSKFRIHPEHLGVDGEEESTCALERGTELQIAMEAANITSYVDMWSLLSEMRADEDVYLRKDTHWRDVGGVAMVRRLVEALELGWDESAVVSEGAVEWEGDLTRLKGSPSTEETERIVVDRDEVVVEEVSEESIDALPVRRYRAKGADLAEGMTLVVHDSFFEPGKKDQLLEAMAAYSRETVFLHWDQLTADDIAVLLEDADRVVVEVAERLFWTRMEELQASD